MNRLTNQYGAFNTPLGDAANEIIREFETKIQAFIQDNNLTPEEIRILSAITNADLACAEMVLRLAIKMKGEESEQRLKHKIPLVDKI